MASLISKTAAKASGSSAEEPDGNAVVDPRDTAKYLLRVTAGPSYDPATHGEVHVNGEAYHVDNELCTADVTIRIKDYHGLPRSSPPDDEYFSHSKHKDDRYSISFAFTPKKDIPGSELVMGFNFDRPIRDRLPPLFKPALRLVTTVIDPGIYCDAYADKPYLYGPALSSFFILRIGDKNIQTENSNQNSNASSRRNSRMVIEGADGDGQGIRDTLGMPENSEKRRKWFLKQKNLDAFTFEAGREYEADFFNPYLDFANFAVRLPGFSISVAKYIDEKTHQLRYVLKNKRTDEVYFVVVFTLLFGKELKAALREGKGDTSEQDQEQEQEQAEAGAEVSEPPSGLQTPEEQRDQYLKPPTQDGLLASLGKWLPRMLQSGGTVSGASSPGTTSSPPRGSVDEMSDAKVDQHIAELSDAGVAETLRGKHASGADA